MGVQTLKEREKQHLMAVLDKTHWDLEMTARLLQIPVARVRRLIRKHDLKGPQVSATRQNIQTHNSFSRKEGDS